MSENFDTLNKPEALCRCAKNFYDRGWMYGTAGNLSAKVDQDTFLITASGNPKGQLSTSDFVSINTSSGEQITQSTPNKPSAETSIHQTIYSLYPDANACFHVHSVAACLATQAYSKENCLRLPNLEMIKGFDIWEEEPNIELPLFNNDLDIAKISQEIQQRFSQSKPKLDALMIKNHGVTVWGNSIQQTFNRVEILEFIMSFLSRTQK